MRTTPDLQTFLAVADAARRHHLPLTAHPVAPPEQLIKAGLGSVEHFLSYPPLNNMTDSERRALLRKMTKSGLNMSNTMTNVTGLISTPYAEGKRILEDTNGALDPRRKYLCGYLIQDWREQVEENKDSPYEELRKELPNIYRDFREMREEGVPYLAGTDAGVVFIYPGFSLHDELVTLVRDLGFTPMEALRIATDGIPRFYGETAGYGAVEPGSAADLVLLDADPLADIHNTSRIAAVSLRGKWLDRAKLDRLLRQVEQAAQANCRELGNR
ncbi:MAG TPA: amidohydrolase family protein [Bryobacteraceae bacterium]|nr:amidohydrolase family protein [Bryobacteraceae bacterium]